MEKGIALKPYYRTRQGAEDQSSATEGFILRVAPSLLQNRKGSERAAYAEI